MRAWNKNNYYSKVPDTISHPFMNFGKKYKVVKKRCEKHNKC